ncbi:MAG: hypothetical protein GX557_00295 [Chloroflexi bacterium]|nr:hypothetical protein [Chloroflexota bacterium]
MKMRERMLAVVQGREHDRVPFVVYDGMFPMQELRALLGADQVGILRWSAVHKVTHSRCSMRSWDTITAQGRTRRTALYTPKGTLFQERAYEPAYGSSSAREHFVKEPKDYEALWAWIEDGVVTEDYARYHRDQAELGDDGLPLAAVERTPYQQLWVEWTGLTQLGYHFADCPDRVEHTIELLRKRAREIFEIVRQSPAPLIDFPDNITAPPIGRQRFAAYCVPLYNELADRVADRGMRIYVHMDGDLKPLWPEITASKVGGLDSFAPAPDNDTSVADAVRLWPDMRLWVNFPSSVHLRSAEGVRAEAETILAAAGHTGHLQIQISENVPLNRWRTSLPAIVDAIRAFGKP